MKKKSEIFFLQFWFNILNFLNFLVILSISMIKNEWKHIRQHSQNDILRYSGFLKQNYGKNFRNFFSPILRGLGNCKVLGFSTITSLFFNFKGWNLAWLDLLYAYFKKWSRFVCTTTLSWVSTTWVTLPEEVVDLFMKE